MRDIIFGIIMIFVGTVEFLVNGFFCPFCSFSVITGMATIGNKVCSKNVLTDFFAEMRRFKF